MTAIEIIFGFLSLLAVGGALMVISSRNPIYSVLWLIIVFFAISGIYILLNAQFLAIVNLIVYAGAIMVLFLFVVMLINQSKDKATKISKNYAMKFAGVIAGGLLLLTLCNVVYNAQNTYKEIANKNVLLIEGNIGLIENLGKALFTDYVVPFEISSILFLSAMIGAIVIGKKEKTA